MDNDFYIIIVNADNFLESAVFSLLQEHMTVMALYGSQRFLLRSFQVQLLSMPSY